MKKILFTLLLILNTNVARAEYIDELNDTFCLDLVTNPQKYNEVEYYNGKDFKIKIGSEYFLIKEGSNCKQLLNVQYWACEYYQETGAEDKTANYTYCKNLWGIK